MKRTTLILLAALTALSTLCGCKNSSSSKKERNGASATTVLVAYFSASGRTEGVAKTVADITGGDLFRIEPQVPYSEADLDWTDEGSRSTLEMKDKGSRPQIAGKVDDISRYDTIYLGYPIWWYVAPTIINTFLEQYDLSGKRVIPFFTSGGSGAGETMKYLSPSAPGAKWEEPKCLNSMGRQAISEWIDSVK